MKSGFVLKLLFSLGLVGYLVSRVDTERLMSVTLSLSYPLLAVVVGLVILQFCVGACRWFLLIRGTGIPLSAWQTFRILLAGMFCHQALPGSLGADTVRIWLVSRHGLPLERAASSVLLDRVAGLVSVLTLLAVSSLTVAKAAANPDLGTIGILVVAGAMLLVAVGLSRAERIADMIGGHRLGRYIAALLRDTRVLWRAGYRSVVIVALSYLLHVVSALALWVVFRALSVEVDYLMVLGALPLLILGTLLPVSVGGWGVREGIMVAIFTMAGTAPEQALAASIVWGLSVTVAAGLGGLVWIATRPLTERAPGRGTGKEEEGQGAVQWPWKARTTPIR